MAIAAIQKATKTAVAVFANVVRITATGLLYRAAQGEWARLVFHDIAGWLMMPLAVLILLAEVRVLKRLVIDPPPASGDADGYCGSRAIRDRSGRPNSLIR